MAETMTKHWTSRSIADFVYRIASDFVLQLETKLESDGISQAKMADAVGVSEGRLSQVFNNPGNLTLKSVVQYAQALSLKVALVAYDDDDPSNFNGPINSEIFHACWKDAGSPRDFFDLAGIHGYVYSTGETAGNTAYKQVISAYLERSASTQSRKAMVANA